MRTISRKISFYKKGKIDETFFRSDEIITPRCQDNYLRFARGEAQLTIAQTCRQVWCDIFIGKRLSFRSAYECRSKDLNALEILPS